MKKPALCLLLCYLLCRSVREHLILNNDNVESAHPATGFVIQLVYILMLVLQIIAYVSQVHKVILPEGLVDHDTVSLDQVNITSNHVFFCILSLVMPRVYCRNAFGGNSCY